MVMGPTGALARRAPYAGVSWVMARAEPMIGKSLVQPCGCEPTWVFPRREHPSKTSCIANGSTTQHGGRLGDRWSFSGPSTAVKELIYTIAIVILPMKPKLSAGQER